MLRMTFRIATILALFVTTAVADDGWVTVTTDTDGVAWQAKKGSLEFTQTKAGVPIAVVIGRAYKPSSNITLEKWYVSLDDCVKEHGTLVTLKMSGDFQFDNDFVFGGGNVASGVAELICGAARRIASEANDKGL